MPLLHTNTTALITASHLNHPHDQEEHGTDLGLKGYTRGPRRSQARRSPTHPIEQPLHPPLNHALSRNGRRGLAMRGLAHGAFPSAAGTGQLLSTLRSSVTVRTPWHLGAGCPLRNTSLGCRSTWSSQGTTHLSVAVSGLSES